MEIGLLKEWNPWWFQKKDVLERLKGRKRDRYSDVVKSIDIKHITIILGVRRSGKSTIMYQMIDRLLQQGIEAEQILLANLEDKKLAQHDLEEIYASYRENINAEKKAFIFLDEIHRREGWESWIRKKYDLQDNIKFVISGSCSYLLKKEYSTLLTGRNLTFEIFPLSFDEFLIFQGVEPDRKMLHNGLVLDEVKHKIIKHLNDYITLGGFPEILSEREEFKNKLLKQYFDDILYKDIIDRHDIKSQKVKNLAQYLITNFTNLVSLRNIRNSLDLSYDTIKDYIYFYKEVFLFFTIDHFSYSFKEQKIFPSKIYCIDNGLRNAVSFTFSKDEGKLAENLVFIELRRRENEVYYWQKKHEVDFVVKDRDQSLTAINVTYGDEVDEREIKGLLAFRKEFKKTDEMLIITKDIERAEEGIRFIPLWKWLLRG